MVVVMLWLARRYVETSFPTLVIDLDQLSGNVTMSVHFP